MFPTDQEPNASAWKENLNQKAICRECREDPPNLVEEFSSGDLVCGSCGLVLGDRIVDTRSEWRTFANDDQGNDDPSRVGDGANALLNGSQLSTEIAYNGENKLGLNIHRANTKINADKGNKGLIAAYKTISGYTEAIGISKNTADTAKHLFKLVEDAKAFKGKSQDAIIAGCIFIACRKCDVPRTFKEIFALTKVSKKEIGRTFKALERFFEQESEKAGDRAQQGLAPPTDNYKATSATGAEALIARYCSQLGLKQQIFVNVAQDISRRVAAHGELGGRSPLSIAAASIFMSSYLLGAPRTPKQIGLIAGVSDGTIRTAYKSIYADRETLVAKTWLEPNNRGVLENLPTP